MHHHARIKGKLILVPFVPQEVLEIRTLPYIFHELFIRQLRFFFYDERASCNSHRKRRSPIVRHKQLRIFFFNLIPGNQIRKNYPTILTIELPSEHHVEFLKLRHFFWYSVHNSPFKCTGFEPFPSFFAHFMGLLYHVLSYYTILYL